MLSVQFLIHNACKLLSFKTVLVITWNRPEVEFVHLAQCMELVTIVITGFYANMTRSIKLSRGQEDWSPIVATNDHLPGHQTKYGRATDSCFVLIVVHQCGVLMVDDEWLAASTYIHTKGKNTWVVVSWKSYQRLLSKGNEMARDRLQGSGEKSGPPYQQHCLPDYQLSSITGHLEEQSSGWRLPQ